MQQAGSATQGPAGALCSCLLGVRDIPKRLPTSWTMNKPCSKGAVGDNNRQGYCNHNRGATTLTSPRTAGATNPLNSTVYSSSSEPTPFIVPHTPPNYLLTVTSLVVGTTGLTSSTTFVERNLLPLSHLLVETCGSPSSTLSVGT
ncbi:hypothetical protein TRVL_05894 [Trypanosoma vivax]|nr:hypothetical protein TRVL_05894 [Trypanosoma vivax]